MATAFIQSWTKTTKQICRLSMKIQRYFRGQRMEHLLNQEVSLSNRKQEEFVELSVKLLTMIKLDSGISTMQLNQNVALVLQLSL